MKNSIWIVIFFFILSFQCSEDEYDMINQDLIFARIYENHSWDSHFEGWIMDNSGWIRGFSLHRNPGLNWKEFSDAGFISIEEMYENLMKTDTVFIKIDEDVIKEFYPLIDDAAEGFLTEASSGGADMGQISYYALQFFPGEKKYRWVILESTGDFELKNTTSEAAIITRWLKNIDPLGSLYTFTKAK